MGDIFNFVSISPTFLKKKRKAMIIISEIKQINSSNMPEYVYIVCIGKDNKLAKSLEAKLNKRQKRTIQNYR